MASVYPVGIDLGTTLSAAAYVAVDGRTQMIPNGEGELLTPSVALFETDKIVVGRDAKHARGFADDRVAETAKRDMGQTHYRHSIRGQLLPPEVIQGYILRKLRDDISTAIGPSYKTVITAPAYFDEPRRKATADAGEMSGLDVLDIVNEPTAAALAFGERLGYLSPSGTPRDALTLLVYDLGGGTFDVTVIRLTPGNVTTLVTDGDAELGGFDWDRRLVDHLARQLQDRFPGTPELDDVDRLRLRHVAEELKHRLSSQQKAAISIQHVDRSINVTVSRDEFETMTAELVERTAFTTRQALRTAGLLWSDIDRLLLVGGSTRMPMIRRMLESVSGMVPDVNVNPDEAVARGAAIFAQHVLASRGIHSVPHSLRITDVNAHSLGIEAVNPETLRRENTVLIPRNTPLPVEVHRTFVTGKDGQQSVKIQLLEGDSTLPEQCSGLAKAAIRNLRPGLPKGTEIDVCYGFTANGRLSVRAELPGQGHEAKIELERVSGLADDRVARWKRIICRDGGFDDFDQAIIGLVESGSAESEPARQAECASARSLEPAVPYGASAAASDALKRQRATRAVRTSWGDQAERRRFEFRVKPARLEFMITVLGHVVASVLGLAIGYYILCWLRPEANVLELRLPGL